MKVSQASHRPRSGLALVGARPGHPSVATDLVARGGAVHTELADAPYAGEGFAGMTRQMVTFVQPLLDELGSDPATARSVMTLGMLCWYLALAPREHQDGLKREFEQVLAQDLQGRIAYARFITEMIARHEAMFPLLHRHRPSSEKRAGAG